MGKGKPRRTCRPRIDAHMERCADRAIAALADVEAAHGPSEALDAELEQVERTLDAYWFAHSAPDAVPTALTFGPLASRLIAIRERAAKWAAT